MYWIWDWYFYRNIINVNCKMNALKDAGGKIYKFPNRTCKECKKYPCFKGIEKMSCDYAKYGCREYKDVSWGTCNV